LKYDARNDAVRALQTLLRYQRHNVARDGVFGAETQRALLKFKKEVQWNIASKGGGTTSVAWCYLNGGMFDGE
jgi:hypothetical protein